MAGDLTTVGLARLWTGRGWLLVWSLWACPQPCWG